MMVVTRMKLPLLQLILLLSLLSALLLPHSASAAPSVVQSQVWDLSGATLAQPRVDQARSELTLRWSAPPALADAAARLRRGAASLSPPLLYTVYALQNGDTADARTSAPHRLCSTRGALECRVPVSSLSVPNGGDVQLQLFVECDFQTMLSSPSSARTRTHRSERGGGSVAAPVLPSCQSASSPIVRFQWPSAVDILALDDAPAPAPILASMVAAPGVALVANDTAVRTALCDLHNRTTVSNSWVMAIGWCHPRVAVCNWTGVLCDATGTNVTGLTLDENALNTAVDDDGTQISADLSVLPALQSLSLNGNPNFYVALLDLSSLSLLRVLQLEGSPSLDRSHGRPLVLRLPPQNSTSLRLLDLGGSGTSWFVPELRQQVLLEFLHVEGMQAPAEAPLELADLWGMKQLSMLSAAGSSLSSNAVEPSTGLSGGALTHAFLSSLGERKPLLRRLDLSQCAKLSFDRASTPDDTWPTIRSPALVNLALAGLEQLRTGTRFGPLNARWLDGLPALRILDISSLSPSRVSLTTSVFLNAAVNLSSLDAHGTLFGHADLGRDLCPRRHLWYLDLSGGNVQSEMPKNVSACWPVIQRLYLSQNGLYGALPDLANLPQLEAALLNDNAFSGPFPATFLAGSTSTMINSVDVSRNALEGPLPVLRDLPKLQEFSASSNALSGPWPPGWWSGLRKLVLVLLSRNMLESLPFDLWDVQLPTVQDFDVSSNLLTGRVPSPIGWPLLHIDSLSFSNNSLSGPYPANLSAVELSLSYNSFSGPLTVPPVLPTSPYAISVLDLAWAGSFSCPIDLSGMGTVGFLQLQGAVEAGSCDLNDPEQVRLPQGIHELDVSDIVWREPVVLQRWIMDGPRVLRARNSSVVGIFDTEFQPLTVLEELDLSHSRMEESAAGVPQLQQWTSLVSGATSLRSLACFDCGLAFSFDALVNAIHRDLPGIGTLETLILGQNDLQGALPSDLFASFQPALPSSVQRLDLQLNPRLSGPLPEAGTVFTSLEYLYLDGTAVSGSLPDSWASLTALQTLSLHDTATACVLVVDQANQLGCGTPSWVQPSLTATAVSLSSGDPSAQEAASAFQCPALLIDASPLTSIALDVEYDHRTRCDCIGGYWGTDGRCVPCPDGCTCEGNYLSSCWPVMQRGRIPVRTNPITGVRVVQDAGSRHPSVRPFAVATMLPCARTLTGESLCGANKNISWSDWYHIIEQGASADVAVVGGSSHGDMSMPPPGWCLSGHQSRLCAQCSEGYFASGRWCLRCLGQGMHGLILACNIVLGVALVLYLYVKSPGAAQSAAALREYLALDRGEDGRGRKAVGLAMGSKLPRALETKEAREPQEVDAAVFSSAAAASDVVFDTQMSLSGSPGAVSESEAVQAPPPSNPLKMLVFHSQQLSLLVRTSPSLPSVLASLLSVVSAGGDSFSLSSLIAMECLTSVWTLETRCWLALAAPLGIGAVTLGLRILECRRPVTRSGFEQKRRSGSVDDEFARSPPSAEGAQSRVPRLYSVCVSLMYLITFPCAQMSLSALTCTDTREAGLRGDQVLGGDKELEFPSRLWLNLYPWQQCDETWRQTVLPPALLGTLLWFVLWPLLSTLLFRRFKRQLSSARVHSGGVAATMDAMSAWPLCSDLLRPFTRRFWYWEQVLLLRRLALVACICILPSDSLFLPVSLFSLIQLSVLLQHYAMPYRHWALNYAEVLSLYLLLLNYLSALLLQMNVQQAAGSGFSHSANAWAVFLFVLNFIFLLLLLGAFFRAVRTTALAAVQRVQQWIARQLRKLAPDSSDADSDAAGSTQQYRRGSGPFDADPLDESDDRAMASPPVAMSHTSPRRSSLAPPSNVTGGRGARGLPASSFGDWAAVHVSGSVDPHALTTSSTAASLGLRSSLDLPTGSPYASDGSMRPAAAQMAGMSFRSVTLSVAGSVAPQLAEPLLSRREE